MQANNRLAAIATPPILQLLKQLSNNAITRETAKAALIEKYLIEGRALYATNCSPCHGASGNGDGQLAHGFDLRPIDFTNSGTLETLVDGYVLWRIAEGGAGLPVEATPWRSSMPSWKEQLSRDEMWKVSLALYDLVGKRPRLKGQHQ